MGNALGSACLAWLTLTGVVYLILYASRRRAEHGWLAAQSLLAAVYPLSRLGMVSDEGAVAIAVALASAASVLFTRAHFGLPTPRLTWAALPFLGAVSGGLAEVRVLPSNVLGGVTLLIVAAAIAHQVEELWRLSRGAAPRFNARLLLVAWAVLGAGVAVERCGGPATTIVGITALAFLYTVALARQHGLSLEEAERHRKELEHRLATIETKTREIDTLNLELRRQIGLRSRQLAKALHDLGARPSVLAPGAVIAGRYRVARHLGTGGMGMVYEVTRVTDERSFALKLLHGHARHEVLARFAREAEILAQLHHPNLVSIVDIDVCDGRLFLVMELVDGLSLAACERELDRSVAARVRILTDIAAGLAAIHGAGIVHRDLKPANVLIPSDGGRAKIADFGVSSFAPLAGEHSTIDQLTATGAIMGTPGYMAPELLHGMRAAGAAVDVFAFGVLAYRLLGGRAPFDAALYLATPEPQTVRSLREIAPGLPADLIALVDESLASSPETRPTAAQLVARLQALPELHALVLPWHPQPPAAVTIAHGSDELRRPDLEEPADAHQ